MIARLLTRVERITVSLNNLRQNHVWTSGNVVKSPFKDVLVPEVTVNEYIWKDLDKWATKTATVCGVTNRSYTYGQMYKHTQVLGANLRKKLKIQDGDTIAVISPNLPEYPIILLGVMAAGATISTFNPLYTAYEIQTQLLLSDSKAIFVHPELVSLVREALKLYKKQIPIISIDVASEKNEGTLSYKEVVDDSNVDLDILKGVNRKPDDVSVLPYSSGTTGLPKGVELTHRNIVANCAQQSGESKQYQETTASNQDRQLNILPMYHSYGLTVATLHKLSVGLKLVTLPRFHPETLIKAVLEHKINIMYLAPPMVLFLGTHPGVKPELFDFINCIVSGAAPLPQSDIEKMFEKAKRVVEFSQGYGLTETGPLATFNVLGSKDYATVGYALPNMLMRIVDGDLNNLGPNEVGELLFKGPNVTPGYKNNPEANKHAFVDGWFRTGDLASIDEKGRVTIKDRLKELIKVKGYQVPPAELEAVIKQHPAVHDAAVIGVTDPKHGEKPKAFVQLEEGAKASDDEIMKFVNERVAPYKKIKEISFIDSIPKNNSGKILRRVLKESNEKAL